MKSQKGINLITLLFIVVIIIFAIVMISGKNDNENSRGNSSTSTHFITKEDRSTYISKCKTISYESLARNPDMYKGNDYMFTGEVIQSMNESNSNETVLRVNVTPKKYTYSDETYYEDTILVYYNYSSSAESRILEKDIITIYGQSRGTYTYESAFGVPITVPAINAMYIDIK